MADQIIEAVERRYNVNLRGFQKMVYEKFMEGKDIFVCAPTGSGKTFCFAFLSEVAKLMGAVADPRPITVVISPLVSLMTEQVSRMNELGVKASLVGELQTDKKIKGEVVRGEVEMLFITPEAIAESVWRKVLSSSVYQNRIKALVIDEAHCVSQWYVRFNLVHRNKSTMKGISGIMIFVKICSRTGGIVSGSSLP